MKGFSPEKIAEYFAPQGNMARLVPGYRHRREQVKLAESIAACFINQEFLVAEAGTGVGKTYAYLLPAILWALEQKEKVVISTRTRALQQQLMGKDIPDIKKVLEHDFTVVEAKGRENFLCWNKYIKILEGRRKFEPEEQEFIQAILRWAESTSSGDRKELRLDSRLMSKWDIVAADRKSCLRDNCVFHDKCFRLKMLKSLDKADLIVTNHALLLSDMLVENSILPTYSYLVVDEAHTFDRLAFDHLSLRFSLTEIGDTLQLLNVREKGYERGYLQLLKGRYPELQALCTEASQLLEKSYKLLVAVFAELGANAPSNYNYSRVIQWQDMESDWLNQAIRCFQDWRNSITLLITKFKNINEHIKESEETGELERIIEILEEYISTATVIIEENLEKENKITWLEYFNGRVLSVASSSLDAGYILYERLYQKLDSLVMVSATLAIEESFNYFLSRTGLDFLLTDDRVNTLLQSSPFNYDKQAQMLIVDDLPEPNQPDFTENIAGVLEEIFLAIGGQVLVLFTSRSQLKEISALLRADCDKNGFNLLVQYEDGEFQHLVEQFIQSPKAVLMGVETFWEGIDLKGEVLKCVVIVRLPFRPPSDPYCAAADRACRLENKNSFQHFMLPDATVRFKQGIGRLIRSEEDRGLVVVLDSRLQKMAYGKVFINSIPIKKTCWMSRRSLIDYLHEGSIYHNL